MPDTAPSNQIGGNPVRSIALADPNGLRLTLLDYGARLASLWAPAQDGTLADVVLGHDTPADYGHNHGYLGATCGRFANRIAGGRIPQDGADLQLDRNEGANLLHGGSRGWDQALWSIADQGPAHVIFTHRSPHGDMGFPGTVDATCTYRIDGLRLTVEMTATTDAPTQVNLAHHSYFNLAGQGAGDILGHRLQVDAAHVLPVDPAKIPTGAIAPVAGTAFDLTAPRAIGQTLPGPEGFDHCFCLSGPLERIGDQLLRPAATLDDPASGRRLRLWTDQPGVQVYTGAHFRDTPGKAGGRYGRFAGIALETEGFPDAPNHPQFPSTRLEPGQVYRHRMLYDFA
jgi:aldose 1-epimerase